jgi:hypothetical protein
MKFKARYVTEYEIVMDASSIEEAAKQLLDKQLIRSKILGIVAFDQSWPDREQTPTPRPPRSTPPSGSPGTPAAKAPAALAHAVAA